MSVVGFWEFISIVATAAYAVIGIAVVATFLIVAFAAVKLAWEGWDG